MKGIVKIEVAEKTKALWSPRTKAACERAQFKVNGDLLFLFFLFFLVRLRRKGVQLLNRWPSQLCRRHGNPRRSNEVA